MFHRYRTMPLPQTRGRTFDVAMTTVVIATRADILSFTTRVRIRESGWDKMALLELPYLQLVWTQSGLFSPISERVPYVRHVTRVARVP